LRQIISTALVAVVVSLVTVTAVGALAQDAPETATGQSIVPSVTSLNAHRVDGRHAVSARASRARRAGKLVATNKQGYLPANIVKPAWRLIQGKPAGFADGVDNEGITGLKVTEVVSDRKSIIAGGRGIATVHCPPNSTVVGGGFSSGTYGINVVVSFRADLNDWYVSAENQSGPDSSVWAIAYCMSTQPSAAISSASKGVQPAGQRTHRK
jgi:hypothetical protein